MYDPSITDLTPEEHQLAGALFDVIDAVRYEMQSDEDPGKLDGDDIVTIVTKIPGPVVTIFQRFAQSNVALAKDLEAAIHGVVRNLKVLESSDENAPT